jgi:hypothetical protein
MRYLCSLIAPSCLALIAFSTSAQAQTSPTPSTPPGAPSETPPAATPPPAETPPPATPPAATIPTPPPTSPEPAKPEAPKGPVEMKGKWNPVFYGFAELDMIHDSTQSFVDAAGNALIQRDESFPGHHGRTQFGVRNSRFGVRMSAPEWEGIKASGQVEVDLLGNQPTNPPGAQIGNGVLLQSEAGFWNNPTMRLRHFILKVETPYIDILGGQYWQLFGWQTFAHPNTVQIQGVPGQIFSRTPQLRLSHTFKTDPVNVDLAVAAARPPQRDSEIPDGQAGLRFLINSWKGVHTAGGAGTSADPLGIGVSGVARRFALPEHIAAPQGRKGKTGWGVSVDAMIPIVPTTMDDRANSLVLTGSFVTGSGIADLYTGMGNGGSPAYPAPAMGNAIIAPVDGGLVAFDSSNNLHTIDVTSYIVGLQYYLPPSGHIWVSGNYSHVNWGNIDQFSAPNAPGIISESDWADGNLFFDLTPAARFGFEYSFFQQKKEDGQKSKNHRFQLSTWFIF